MPVPFTKPALPVDKQIDLMVSRGMVVPDRAVATTALEQIGYYRLSAYALAWRQPATDQFLAGASLDQVLALYEFDRRLRDQLWSAMEPIEIALRTRITLHLGLTYGPFAHTDPVKFWSGWDHTTWLRKIDEEATRSHEQFIRAYKLKYDGFPTLPLWMATEIMSFGSLSKLFENLHMSDQRAIARAMGMNEIVLKSWLHVVSVTRNACAHHARCWDRGWGIKPTFPAKDPQWQTLNHPGIRDRTGAILFIIARLLAAIGHPNRAEWQRQIRAHVAPMVAPWGRRMGLPADFDTHPLWT